MKCSKRNSKLMKTRLERDLQQMEECAYGIPCQYGRNYIGETGRPLAKQLCEHKHNFEEGFLEKMKISPTCL
jgi:hypothetical protein